METKPKMQVWYIYNPPNKGVRLPVETVEEAKTVLRKWFQDALEDDNIFVNVGGLEVWEEEGGWCEWRDEEMDFDICQIMDEEDEE